MKNELTVRQRVSAALHLAAHERPGQPISVLAVCRMTGINRANLYANYPDLVDQIHSAGAASSRAKRVVLAVADKPTRTVTDESAKSLLYLCLELRAEVESLKSRLSTEQQSNAEAKRTKIR